MSAVKPRAAAPPIILTAFEAAPLDLFAVVLAGALELDEEEVEVLEVLLVADEAAGDVDVAGAIEEVRVTPAASHVCWAIDSAVARSAALQLDSKH